MEEQRHDSEQGKRLQTAMDELTKLKLLTESVSSGVVRLQYNNGLLIDYANKGLYDILKCTKEEFLEKNQNHYESVILPEDWKQMRVKIDQAVAQNSRFEIEYRVRNKEGRVAWRLMNGTPLREEGRIILQCSISDTTKIKETERRLDSLVENLPGGIWRIFYNGQTMKLEYASEGIGQITGYSPEDCERINRELLEGKKDIIQDELSFLRVSAEKAFYEGKGDREEHQIHCKNGKKRWIELRSSVVSRTESGVLIQYVILDINEQKNAEERLRRERMRLDVVAGLSTDSIFEYDVEQDTMYYYNQSEKFLASMFNVPIIEHYTEKILDGSMASALVHEEDEDKIIDLCRQLRSSQKNIYCEMRKQYDKGKYCWIAVEGKRVEGENGQGGMVIGKISNIEERMERETVLKQQSEQDSLTGLYNNKLIREKISERIAVGARETAYLLIADVDNFKAVNDTMGHLFGDAVLCTFADSLTTFFEEALIGRIGGDEFLLYIENISSEEIHRRTAEINKKLARIYAEGVHKVKVSASFGLAKCSEHLSFTEMVERADGALYFLKEHIKGGIMEYREGMRMGEFTVSAESEIDFVPEAKVNTEGDLISFARELFERVTDTKGAIRILSDRISRFFEFQDILFVRREKDGSMKKVFHWGERDMQQFYNAQLDYRQESDWNTLLYRDDREHVVLLERDINGENANHAKSMLSIRIREMNEEGYMIFVDRKKERTWEEEAGVLEKLSGIIFVRMTEMEQKRRDEEYTAYMISHDKITGLPNYTYFLTYCGQYVKDHPGKRYALIYSDFSNFQYLNEVYGYTAGDQVLRDYAKKIQEGTGIQYARVTGDKFLSMHEFEDISKVKEGFLRYAEEFSKDVNRCYEQCKLAVVGGIAEVDQTLESFAMNVDNANVARKSAKRDLHTQVLIYTHELREKFQWQMEIVANMAEALESREFIMYLQPKMNMETGLVMGAEALVRWIRRDGTMIRPDQFVPIFEKNGFITKVDFEILRQALQLQQTMRQEGKKVVPVSVNFSRKHQDNPDDIRMIDELLKEYEVQPEKLEIEITESAFMEDIEPLLKSIQELQARNIAVSIDDFGAGYSSLNVLAKFKADVVKLDRQFLLNVEKERGTFATDFLMLLIRMMKQLGFKVVAEGVETKEQIEVLRQAGCRFAQGYYYAKPMPVPEFLKFVEEHGVETAVADK
ncbi:MAG: EAL domain-containing protein [Lachnospiraceae bacterium]